MNVLGVIGDFFNLIINKPLGYILGLCYHLTNNYGVSILLFTLLVRLIISPFSIKQQKSTAQMIRFQPKMAEIQKKYSKDQQKLQEETMKLYQQEGYNPMSGCLPLLIQMPVLYGLVNVIYRPLTYIVGLTSAQISSVIRSLWGVIQPGSPFKTIQDAFKNYQVELYAANAMNGNMDKLTFLPKGTMTLDFRFLGLDLAKVPGWSLTPLILIPLLCYASSFLSVWASNKIAMENNPQMGQAGAMMNNKGMLLFMPLISTFFAVTVPAGVGFYWICSSLVSMLQVIALNKFYNPKKLAVKLELESQQRRKQQLNALEKAAFSKEDGEQTPPDQESEQKKNEDYSRKIEEIEKDSQNIIEEIQTGKKTEQQIRESNKQKMKENRKRLSASRVLEEKKKNQGKNQKKK